MVNSTEDIKNFIKDKSLNKIFILCGKKSFVTSGAEIIFKKIISSKEYKLFYKNSEIPILEELIEIITIRKTRWAPPPYDPRSKSLRSMFGGGHQMFIIQYAKRASHHPFAAPDAGSDRRANDEADMARNSGLPKSLGTAWCTLGSICSSLLVQPSIFFPNFPLIILTILPTILASKTK